MTYLIGIDIGTSGTKALACDTGGQVLATVTAEHDVSSPQPGWSEQDPRQWWDATIEAVGELIERAHLDANDCKGIGLSGQMHGSVFLGDDGPETAEPLRPALLWNDQRTAAECEQIERTAGGREELIEMVGNPALTGFTAPKILWLRDHEPQVYEKVRHVLLPKDYIRYRMTGEYATEVGDASGTLLLNVSERAWHKGLIEKLGLDMDWLPDCHESHVVSGELSEWAAQRLGLRAGVPVVGGSGDQPAGAVGNGIARAGVVSATLGTSGVVFAHADEPTYDPQGRVHTMCHAVEGKWCVFGCMLSAGGSLQWFRNHMARWETDQAKRDGMDPYELMTDEADHAAPGCGGLLFMPYLTGERCPHPDPDARGGWIGLTARHTRADMIRSVMEGVTFGMNDALRIIREMDVDVSSVRLSGGGARSDLWRQMQADIYGADTAITNAGEGPAYGAAILAGVGTGIWSSVPEACEAIIREAERRHPDPETAEHYRRVYSEYKKLYPMLRSTFARLADL